MKARSVEYKREDISLGRARCSEPPAACSEPPAACSEAPSTLQRSPQHPAASVPIYLSVMPEKAERLRALHKAPRSLLLPNAWDAASARVFEAEGFPAVATTSAGVAAALGYPDGAVAPTHEMIEAISR